MLFYFIFFMIFLSLNIQIIVIYLTINNPMFVYWIFIGCLRGQLDMLCRSQYKTINILFALEAIIKMFFFFYIEYLNCSVGNLECF